MIMHVNLMLSVQNRRFHALSMYTLATYGWRRVNRIALNKYLVSKNHSSDEYRARGGMEHLGRIKIYVQHSI